MERYKAEKESFSESNEKAQVVISDAIMVCKNTYCVNSNGVIRGVSAYRNMDYHN